MRNDVGFGGVLACCFAPHDLQDEPLVWPAGACLSIAAGGCLSIAAGACLSIAAGRRAVEKVKQALTHPAVDLKQASLVSDQGTGVRLSRLFPF